MEEKPAEQQSDQVNQSLARGGAPAPSCGTSGATSCSVNNPTNHSVSEPPAHTPLVAPSVGTNSAPPRGDQGAEQVNKEDEPLSLIVRKEKNTQEKSETAGEMEKPVSTQSVAGCSEHTEMMVNQV